MPAKHKTKAVKRMTGKSHLRSAISEIAQDAAAGGLLEFGDADKITRRMLGPAALPGAADLTGTEIAAIRGQARMSQAVFAQVLAVSVGTLSKWERGDLQPRGPVRRLLQIIKAKGVTAVL